jgi:hypothetical protein
MTYGGGSADAFLTKVTADARVAWSTFLGGTGRDYVWDAAPMPDGGVVIVGSTHSPNFPAVNAFQARPGGTDGGLLDGFVTRFAPDGAIVFSSFAGGDDYDELASVAVAGDGTIWIAGWTSSGDFPVRSPVSQLGSGCRRNIVQCPDGVVLSLTPSGDLEFATYLGGMEPDRARSIDVSADGLDVVVAGVTKSANFPKERALKGSLSGGPCSGSCGDGFVLKLVGPARDLAFATFFGGSHEDDATGVSLSPAGDIWLGGWTRSADLAELGLAGAFKSGCATPDEPPKPCADAFAAALTADGQTVTHGTFLGGKDEDRAFAVRVDDRGWAAIVGSTESTDFPLASPLRPRHGGGINDGFIAVVEPGVAGPVFSAFFGGLDFDATAAAAWQGDRLWVAGRTGSIDLPQERSFQSGWAGDMDGFVAQVRLADDGAPSPTPANGGQTGTPTPSAVPSATLVPNTPTVGTLTPGTPTPGGFQATVWLPTAGNKALPSD